MPSLKNDLRIWKLARDLDLPAKDDPLGEILAFCDKWARDLLKICPCDSLTDLLETAATTLNTTFREIHTDDELHQLRKEFLRRGENEFALVDHELGPDCFAITFSLLNPKRGERPYISIIDCRGDKRYKVYYSKWHELAHLITLTGQGRLKFCRTHPVLNKKDPEETLMEIIAGHVGFLPEMIKRHAKGPISFEKIASVRQKLCPEASTQSSTIGIANAWPTACTLVEARLEYKKAERKKLIQPGFEFVAPPQAELRIVHVNHNSKTHAVAKLLHPNMRVPMRSVIYRAFASEQLSPSSAHETLDWWETKKGGHLPPIALAVEARKQGDSIQALIIPLTAGT
jgi:hypothetical protein